MAKQTFKPGNMLYPLPAVLVTTSDGKGKENVFTVAWTGTVCTNPPMVSISVKPERYSHKMILDTREFVVNLTTEDMTWAVDYCGVKSGRDVDKFEICNLKREKADHVKASLLKDSPVNIECKVVKVEHLGSHDMFLANVMAVHVEQSYMNKSNKFDLKLANPIVYSHGEYFGIGKKKGSFGYSVAKKKK